MNYVAILAAIPAVAGFIGQVVFTKIGFGLALTSAILGYVMAFVSVYTVAFITDALAPTFGGRKDMASALKLTVYPYTPAWVAGILALIPMLGWLAILGLYGIYLLYLDIPVLMKSPQDRTVLYAVTIIVCAIIVYLVIGFIIAAILFRMLV